MVYIIAYLLVRKRADSFQLNEYSTPLRSGTNGFGLSDDPTLLLTKEDTNVWPTFLLKFDKIHKRFLKL